MKRLAFVLVAFTALSAAAQYGEQQSGVRVENIFEGTLQVNNVPVRVVERAFSITHDARSGELGSGFRLVFLHSGRVIATINGREEKHRGGDYWTVPAGATFTVAVTSEMAVLHVTSMTPAQP